MRLIDYRFATGKSRTDFAADIGVSYETLRRYEKDGDIPKPKVMARILLETGGEVQQSDFQSPAYAEAVAQLRASQPAPRTKVRGKSR